MPRAHLIWKSTIAGLILACTLLILFDGYIFLFRVRALDNISFFFGEGEEVVPEVRRNLLDQAAELLETRARIVPLVAPSAATSSPDEATSTSAE